MVLSIARQSVILKCMRRKSVLVGNYELYYLAGLMNKCFNIGANANMKPDELVAYIQEKCEGLSPNDEREEYLIKMIMIFEALDTYDEQMRTLFEWGENEKDLWQVNTSVTY